MNHWKCSNCSEINEAHYDVCCKKCGEDIKNVYNKYKDTPLMKSPFQKFRATGKNPPLIKSPFRKFRATGKNLPGSTFRIAFLRVFLFLIWLGFILILSTYIYTENSNEKISSYPQKWENIYNHENLYESHNFYIKNLQELHNNFQQSTEKQRNNINIILLILFINLLVTTAIISLLIKVHDKVYEEDLRKEAEN